MDINNIVEVLQSNSILIIFIIAYLEGLNLTGIPAIVILPTIGYFITSSQSSFIYIYVICLIASILSAITYYSISYKFGGLIFDYFYNKFPRTQKALDRAKALANKHGAKVCFLGRIIPSVRTFISLISGVLKVRFRDYIIYSSIGLAIWNLVLISLGYIISLGF